MSLIFCLIGKQNGSVSAMENNTAALPYSQESRHASSLALHGTGTPRAVSQEDVSRWVSLYFFYYFLRDSTRVGRFWSDSSSPFTKIAVRRIRHRSSLANIKQGSFAGHVQYFRACTELALSHNPFVRTWFHLMPRCALHERLVLHAIFSIITRVCKFKNVNAPRK